MYSDYYTVVLKEAIVINGVSTINIEHARLAIDSITGRPCLLISSKGFNGYTAQIDMEYVFIMQAEEQKFDPCLVKS